MKKRIGLVFLLLLAISTLGKAQKSYQEQEKLRVFVEPRESVLPLIAYQPNCPLEFQNVSFLSHVGGGGAPNYEIRNVSGKPITEFKVAVSAFGTEGSRFTFKAENPSEWIMPGDKWPRSSKMQKKEHSRLEIVPLTDELRQKGKVGPPMKGVLVFMVIRVVFADGSEYSDEIAYRELQKLFENIEPPDR